MYEEVFRPSSAAAETPPWEASRLIDLASSGTAQELSFDASLGGIEIVRTSARRHGRGLELRLVIDKAGGVDVAMCERISRRLNAALEHFTDPYTLSVESAGLERPLMRPEDYQRFIGSNVKVTTSLAIGGAKTHRGRLEGMRGTNIVLGRDSGELRIPLPLIKNANLEFDIRADLAREKQERRRKT